MKTELVSGLLSRLALILFAGIFAAMESSAQTPPDVSLLGKWSGIVTQTGFGSYPTIMTITGLAPGQNAGVAEYPTLSCTGSLVFSSVVNRTHVFAETASGGNCINERIEIAKIAENSIQWNAFLPGGNVLIASGVLSRAAGDDNSALAFDGLDDVVRTPLRINQTSSSPGVTLEAWVYPTSNSSGRHQLISSDDSNHDWSILREGGQWYFFNGTSSQPTGFTVDLNQWQHIAAAFIPNVGVRFYKNGREFFSPVISYEASDNPIAIGDNPAAQFSEFFAGLIDEVRVWNRVRTQAEIQAAMNVVLAGNEPGLAGYWPFDEGQGTTTADATGKGSNAVIDGAVWLPSTAPISQSARNAAFLRNGSFEFATVNPGNNFITLSNGSTAINGWTITGGTIDYIGAYWTASDSSRSLDLNGNAAGSISQTLKTLKGAVYHLQFDMAGNPECGASTKRLRISAAGVSREFDFNTGGNNRLNMGWQKKAFEFIALDTLTTLTFTSLVSGACGPAIDKVRLSKPDEDIVPPAVPQGLRAAIAQNQVTLTWNPNTEPDLLRYRIYRSTNYPAFTLLSSVSANTTRYVDSGLEPNVIYFYLITAVDNANNESGYSDDVSNFVPQLTDLEVSHVQAPPRASSNQPIQINWVVTNIGRDGTQAPQWFDDVYLSPTPAFDPQTAIRLGQFENFSALDAGEPYANSATFTLPRDISGDRYIIVRTDIFSHVPESNDNNNLRASTPVQVALSPFPDLQVTDVIAPGNAFSGDSVQIRWTVQNRGPGRAGSARWFETIFLAKNDTLDFNFIGSDKIRVNDPVLGIVTHEGGLDSGKTYAAAAKVKLPHATFGDYFIFVYTDLNGGITQLEEGLVYEYRRELNISAAQAIRITLTPPPDLTVARVIVSSVASLGEDVTVQWTITNQGSSAPFEKSWEDIAYLSRARFFHADSVVALAVVRRDSTLTPGASYTVRRSVRIPNGFAGPNYIFVKTDGNNGVFEYTFENNNMPTAPEPITINAPDLFVRHVEIPGSAGSGKSFDVSWTVANRGPGAVFNLAWNDRVYLSRQTTFNPDSATVLGAFTYANALRVDSSYTLRRTFTLPNGVSGESYVFVEANWDRRVFENLAEANNRERSTTAMRVDLSPWPDLRVTAIDAPTSVRAGDRLAVTWTSSNHGAAAAENTTWTDRVYLSPGTVYDPAKAVLLASADRDRSLAPGAAYSQSRTINLSTDLSGTYCLTVQTDADNRVYEHTDENNNLLHSSAISITPYPPVDLAARDLAKPDSAFSGSSVIINFAVENIGEAATLTAAWNDRVYLSLNRTLEPNADLLMATVARSGVLRANEKYQRAVTLRLPNGFTGNYFVIVESDAGRAVSDADRSNNVIASASPLRIVLASSPDLLITRLRLPAQVNAGQPARVLYTVENRGQGNLHGATWYDAFYLSSNASLDNNDAVLTAPQRRLSLPPNASYTDSVEVEMPSFAAGTYFLIAKTDSRNDIYEHNAELNNVAVGETASTGGGGDTTGVDPFKIIQPQPADLIVSQIVIPANATPGEEITIKWTLKNIGANRAKGRLREAAYISADTVWQVEDPVFGVLTHDIDIAPGGSQQFSMKVNLAKLFRADAEGNLTEELPGLTPGQYHAIVRTDIRRNIRESNTANNTLASAGVMNTDVPELRLGVPVTGMLTDGKKLYYRVNVDANLDLRLKLTNSAVNASNEIYVAYGRVPSVVDYDFAGRESFSANQEVLVPTTKAGVYFALLVSHSSNTSTNDFMLLGEALPFSVFDITPDAGGAGGRVTTTIRGAGFRDSIAVYLSLSSDSLLAGQVLAQSNSVELKVRWDLKNVALGAYDVVLVNPSSEEIRLNLGFLVEERVNNKLTVQISTPEFLRAGGIASYEIKAVNDGNVDIDFVMVNVMFPAYLTANIRTFDFFAPPVHPDVVDDFSDEPVGFQFNNIGALVGLAKNIAPGSELSAHFEIKGGILSDIELPVYIDVKPFGRDEFILMQLASLAETRNILLSTQHSLHEELTKFLVSEDWLGAQLQHLFETWLFDDSLDSGPPEMLSYNPNQFQDSVDTSILMQRGTAATCEEWVEGAKTLVIGVGSILVVSEKLRKKLGLRIPKFLRDNVKKLLALRIGAYFARAGTFIATLSNTQILVSVTAFGTGAVLGGHLTCKFAELSGYLDRGACTDLSLYVDIFNNYRLKLLSGVNEVQGWTKAIIDAFKKREISLEKLIESVDKIDARTFCTAIRRAIDPNDITGPAGFGDERWITATQTLPYTIRFENDSTRATAAAQVVTITQKLDSTLDARSFRLGSFGFANLTFTVPENRAFYSERLDARDSLGVFVDVTAGIDVTTNEAFWIFHAIDPATGQLPVFNGFLPVNDPQHRGEGFANYTIRPKRDATTGDVVRAKARIVFDTNEPIDTPEIFNTIDAVVPQSRVTALPSAFNKTTLTVSWAGADDVTGSQIRDFALYVSTDGKPFELLEEGITDTSLVFSGDFGSTYRFFTIVRDNAGNVEALKTIPEASVTLDPTVAVAENKVELPKTFELYQNYPNPFNPTTIIKYDLPVPSEVKLEIFDILGRRVRVLVDTKQNAGFHNALWDGKTASGRSVATGVYFYRIEAKGFVKTRKMLVVR